MFRFRHMYMTLGSLLVIALWILTDPDSNLIQNLPFGASTVAMLVITLKSVIYIALLHLSRRALIDYVDFKVIMNKAMESPQGAGSFAIAVGLVFLSSAILILAAVSN